MVEETTFQLSKFEHQIFSILMITKFSEICFCTRYPLKQLMYISLVWSIYLTMFVYVLYVKVWQEKLAMRIAYWNLGPIELICSE